MINLVLTSADLNGKISHDFCASFKFAQCFQTSDRGSQAIFWAIMTFLWNKAIHIKDMKIDKLDGAFYQRHLVGKIGNSWLISLPHTSNRLVCRLPPCRLGMIRYICLHKSCTVFLGQWFQHCNAKFSRYILCSQYIANFRTENKSYDKKFVLIWFDYIN